MVDCNVTYIINPVTNYASIIGTIIGGSIAAVTGIILSIYINKKAIRERKRIVARAFYEEISSFHDAFELLLEDYNTKNFDEAFNNHDNPRDLQQFQFFAVDQIVNLQIATWGPYASFLQEKNSFTVFLEDIYKFDDIYLTRNLLQLFRYLMIADKHYQNFSHDERHPPTDLGKFLETIENVMALIEDEEILDNLLLKSKKNIPLIKKISLSLNAYKNRLYYLFVQSNKNSKKE
jgi:hypothetical protein